MSYHRPLIRIKSAGFVVSESQRASVREARMVCQRYLPAAETGAGGIRDGYVVSRDGIDTGDQAWGSPGGP